MSTPIRILVIEDTPADFKLIVRHLLTQGVTAECHRVETLPELEAALAGDSYDLVLSDYKVPGMVFQESLIFVQQRWPDLPVILMSGSIGEEQAVEMLKQGADDFLLKENLARLVPAMERSLRTAESIRQRKCAEVELQKALQLQMSMLESIGEGIHCLNTEGRVVFESPSALKLFRSDTQHTIGYDAHSLIHHHRSDGSEYPVEECPIYRTLHDGQTRRVDNEVFFRNDGTSFPVDYTCCAMRNQTGAITGVVVSFRDITERKRAEDALAAEATRRRILIEGSRDGIVILDQEGGVFEANRRFAEMLGYTAEEVQHLHVWDWDRDWSREQVLEAIRTLGPGGTNFETRHWRKDGTRLDVAIANSGAELGGQKLVFCVCHDITDRKIAEARNARETMRTEFLLAMHQRAPQMTDKEIFDHVLEQAVQLTGSAIGFFHQVSEDQNTIILTTWNREALKSCTAAFDTHYPLREAGNWVDCVRQQRPVIYNDYAHSPNQRGLPAGHTSITRFMSIPVIQDGIVRIIFGVGNKATDYDQEDMAQLQVVANELHKIMVQRAAQQRLALSEQRFRNLVETTFDWVWEVDAEGRYTYVSPKIEELLGHTPDEVLGRTPFDLMPEAEAKRVAGIFQTKLERRESFSALENINLHKCGRRVILESSGVPVFGPEGQLQGYRGMDRDVTERKQAEAALQRSEAEFRAMFEVASIGMAQADVRTGQWLRVNGRLCAITGYGAEELLGMQIGQITHPDDRERDWEAFQRVIRGEAPDYHLEKRYLRKDGSIAWVSVNMTAVRDPDGQPVRTIATIEDITERKAVEAQISAQLQELQRWHDVTLDREQRILQLKQQINELLAKAGQPIRYPSAAANGTPNK